MAENADEQITRLAASSGRGSVVAAAGCGKTEQIARATVIADGRRLILTHTHAGVDVLRSRLAEKNVPRDKFRIETIAGWALQYAASFPKRSAVACTEPESETEWKAVYDSGAALIKSGAVDGVLAASYGGVFVDEYQDCSQPQHEVFKALAGKLPVCVFGDPLQAIFDFKGQRPVDWNTDVYPAFAKLGELKTPHRWEKLGNRDLASWLGGVRTTLEGTGPLDLRSRPACVNWEPLPADPRFRQAKVIGTCKAVMGKAPADGLVIMGDAANINARAALAQKLASAGFANIEPLGCPTLYGAAKKIESSTGGARLEAVMDFVCNCMTGAEQKPFLDAVASHQAGRKQGAKQFGDLIAVGLAVAAGSGDDTVLRLIEGFHERRDTRLFRDEMFFAMRAALRMKCAGQALDLRDAIWQVQNRLRHAGRVLRRRCIGSVLLVKGLEFDHAVIVHSPNMTRKDWYVALTRATKSVTVLAPANQVSPAS